MDRKTALTIFASLLLTIVSMSYFLLYNQNYSDTPLVDDIDIKEAPEIVSTDEATPVIQNTATPTISGWQTYQNHTKKLSFSYPPQWMIVERDASDTILYQNQNGDTGLRDINNSGTEKTTTIYLGPNYTLQGGLVWSVTFTPVANDSSAELQQSVDQIANSAVKTTTQIKSITFNNIDAKHVLVTDSNNQLSEYILFVNNNFIYIINGSTYVFDETYAKNLIDIGYQGTFDKTTYHFKDFYESFMFD